MRNNESGIQLRMKSIGAIPLIDWLDGHTYTKSGPKSTRLLNAINSAEIAADLNYVGTVLGIPYR